MAILSGLPPALTEALNNPPVKGSRNVWLFTVAKRARHFASPEKVRSFLRKVASRWDDRDFGPEIDRAVARTYSEKPRFPGNRRISAWPDFNPAAWERRKHHPVPFSETPLEVTAEMVVDRLFPGDPLVCAALDTRSAQTQPRDAWRGKEAALQFIVANPMTAETGLNQSGRVSARCHDNATKQRTYLVIEFDRGTLAEQAAILGSLSTKLTPLTLVVWSGGKSLHGWFQVQQISEYAKLRFFRHAVYLGADSSLWDPAKLVRMPGGRRDNGETQHVLHFNPNPFHE